MLSLRKGSQKNLKTLDSYLQIAKVKYVKIQRFTLCESRNPAAAIGNAVFLQALATGKAEVKENTFHIPRSLCDGAQTCNTTQYHKEMLCKSFKSGLKIKNKQHLN